MPEPRYPTDEEFWKRLTVREVEPDLQDALRQRLERQAVGTPRLGPDRGATATAVARRLVPSATVPAEALAAFLDWSFDRQLGRGDERAGVMPTPELLPAGLDAIEQAAQLRYGRSYPELADHEQDVLLADAEHGRIALDGRRDFDSSTWFRRVRGKLLLGYGSDPRGMVEMGFPGPSYKPGHVWLDRAEVQARVARKPGYLWL